MMEKRRVVVTGLGTISPVGCSTDKFWSSLKKGKSGIRKITHFDASEMDSQICGDVIDFKSEEHFNPKEARHTCKFVQYAIVAAKEAIEMSGLDMDKENPDRVGVIIGSGIGSLQTIEKEYSVFLEKGPKRISPFLIPKLIVNEAAGQVSIKMGAKGPCTCVTTACATGTHSIGDAMRLIQFNEADVMFAGGTENATTVLGVGGFAALKALSRRNDEPEKASRPFDLNRDGFIMAEGAGVVILEELKHAKKRGAKILAEVIGYGRTSDAYHVTAPDPTGSGAIKAMQLAIKDAQLNPGDVDYINAHGTSTKLNDKVETLAIRTTFNSHAKKLMISSTKSMTGHLLGAAGGIEFIACVCAINDRTVPPTINYETPDPDCNLDYVPNQAREAEINVALSNSLGFGGHNATLIVKKFTS